jgi:phage gpG-like protein
MSFRFSFEVQGKKEFDRAFNRVEEHISDLRPLWPHVTRTMQDIMEEQFKSEGSKGRGGKWKDLSPAYEKWKSINYAGKPILQRSGRMFDSLTSKTGDTVLIEEKQEYGFGTNLFYASFHQSGTTNMPARELFSFTDESRTRLTKGIQRGLLEIIKTDRQVTQSLEVQS